jgi:hypothetical protein
MRKTRPIPPIRLSLILVVFVAGLGVGATAIAVSRHRHVRHVTVTRTIVSSQVAPSPSTAGIGATATGHSATSSAAPGATGSRRRPSLHGSRPIVTPELASSFAALASQLDGSVGLAVAPLGAGPIETLGPAQIAHAWSTSKVPVLVTLLATDEQTGHGLDSASRQDATLALTESDNASIEALFNSLEQLRGGLVPASEAVQQMFRKAGDQTAVVNTAPNDEGFTTFGQSEWSLRDEIIFYRALARGCLIDPADTSYVLGLMGDVIPSQRWGAGSAGYPTSLALRFKGGWGPVDGAYQVRQTAIVGSGNRGYTMSMIALPASGSFTDGTNMLTAVATWARRHFDLESRNPPGGCSAPS